MATVVGDGPGATLLFEGHTDVVTEGSLDEWTVDPYEGIIRDGRLYGRGAADMKSGLAAMVYAVRALQLAGGFPGCIKVCALADEEGMMIGVHHLVDSGAVSDVDGAIVCEPEGGEICPVSKGAVRFTVTFAGAMAHGAMPQHGRNPIPAIADFLRVLDHFAGRPDQPARVAPAPRANVCDADRADRRRSGPDQRYPRARHDWRGYSYDSRC
ncbi:M20 family metallopeptidase [Fodinicola feengrottensis]|uniref:M20 family metallopeptidase n=1 Tax=Fodinicola feengrottensis TaxID=435914 RepID=UPI00244194EF|nr:M20/M25/M40 family metallo-hydrolase [Fodinicola feengrottensis]